MMSEFGSFACEGCLSDVVGFFFKDRKSLDLELVKGSVDASATNCFCDEYERFVEEVAIAAAAEEKSIFQRDSFRQNGGWQAVENGGRVGMVNLRNSCWMNSVMQVLAHLGPFTSHVLDLSDDAEAENGKPDAIEPRLGRSMRELFRSLWQEHQEGPVIPGMLHVLLMKRDLNDTERFSRRGVKEDALDFIGYLLSKLEIEMKNDQRPPLSLEDASPKINDLRSWAPLLQKAQSPIASLFKGSLVSTVRCMECDYRSKRPEDTLYLSLPLSDGCAELRNLEKPLNLEEALARVATKEVVTGYECDGCKKKVEATKNLELDELPPVLILQLLRFSFDYMTLSTSKIQGRVELPNGRLEGIDLSVCVSERHKGNALYDIVGVVNHHGPDTSCGHYTAHCKHDIDGQWYKFNDEEAEKIDESSAFLPECAYVICLVRRREALTLPNPQAESAGR